MRPEKTIDMKYFCAEHRTNKIKILLLVMTLNWKIKYEYKVLKSNGKTINDVRKQLYISIEMHRPRIHYQLI
jgi:hypothetical protein